VPRERSLERIVPGRLNRPVPATRHRITTKLAAACDRAATEEKWLALPVYPKFSFNPVVAHCIVPSRPLSDSVIYAVRMSAPPKQIFVG
jgi:hypothetical protein